MSIFGGSINNSEVAKASFFTVYTPAATNTGGTLSTQSLTGRYIQLGKLVYVEIFLTINGVTGASPQLFVSLPFAPDKTFSTSGLFLNTVNISGFELNSNKFVFGSINGITPPPQNFMLVQNYDGTTAAVLGKSYALAGWYSKQ